MVYKASNEERVVDSARTSKSLGPDQENGEFYNH